MADEGRAKVGSGVVASPTTRRRQAAGSWSPYADWPGAMVELVRAAPRRWAAGRRGRPDMAQAGAGRVQGRGRARRHRGGRPDENVQRRSDLVKAGAEALGGGKGGGGRPDLAQAGGPDGSKAEAALAAIEARLAGQ